MAQEKKFDVLLNKYWDTYRKNPAKARRYLQKLDYKNNFYLLRCIAQTYLDESQFEPESNKRLKETNFRKWRMAEKYIIQAFKMNSDNAEVVYTMGDIRKQNFQDDIAIYCFEKVINLGAKKIASQEYSGGIDFAKELINDARFEMYRLHHHINPKLANKYLEEYKKNIKRGTSTIFIPLKKFLLD
ncbi:MAG: hypothetical protein KGJ07_08835 [Patescibacteria group bacterium]|nr:hypothetical protein [Patescibacteria group bacterium]